MPDRTLADHIEEILDMVEIGSGDYAKVGISRIVQPPAAQLSNIALNSLR